MQVSVRSSRRNPRWMVWLTTLAILSFVAVSFAVFLWPDRTASGGLPQAPPQGTVVEKRVVVVGRSNQLSYFLIVKTDAGPTSRVRVTSWTYSHNEKGHRVRTDVTPNQR
jgi:hypothetical protein